MTFYIKLMAVYFVQLHLSNNHLVCLGRGTFNFSLTCTVFYKAYLLKSQVEAISCDYCVYKVIVDERKSNLKYVTSSLVLCALGEVGSLS